ncbi:ABC transporter substrate-binding protein [Limobrevibacterium gyesilva]|uniref:ABC transporter substrate-binding protein n=1 Tax=Limobrevibacterium gyesilva TaxID=2991712 RepID=A0AA42CDL6_9PROT|nr:ABC transporter substrate-binding protein [Limobrevibacterium gyesilva]MCW3474049.1 ABC transporter substrate-binding protein [Limobrevibacterium gyesilva]
MDNGSSVGRRFVLGGGVGLATLATMGMPTAARAAAVRGGRMVYARYADSLFLDPVLSDANVDIWVMNSIYDTLLMPTPEGIGVQEGLATKWVLGDGGKALTLTLREGVKFSDGTPLKASDVKWSLDRARNPKNGAWNEMIASIDAVEITDPSTVVLKLKHPDPTLLPALAMFNTGILPQAAFAAAPGATEDEKAKAFAEKPIGTGPFMLTEWQRGQRMLLKRNPHYWKKAPDGQPLPYLDELEFAIIPDDATRILKLKAGEIHGTEFVPYSRVKELQADKNLRMELWPSTRVAYLTLYVRDKLKNGQDNPLSNVKVRQALNYAVNKDAVIAITTLGLGKPLQSFMSSSTPLSRKDGPVYRYDPAKAKALLAEAGFANGLELSCIALAGNQDEMNNLTTVQQMWAQIGVRLKIELLDNPTRTARYRAEDFQMRTAAWTDDIADPSEITSYFAYYPNIHALHSGWEEKRVNELFLQSQQEVDPAKRQAQYAELQKIYVDAAPILFLYETPYPVAFRGNAKGFVQIPLGNNYFEAAYVEK